MYRDYLANVESACLYPTSELGKVEDEFQVAFLMVNVCS
jgi:hypothetical protein